MTVDPRTICPGYVVFARPDGLVERGRVGPFVGVVETVLYVDGAPYVHVRSGLPDVGELFLPLAEVRLVGCQQVHLQVAREDLLGQAWRLPAGDTAPPAVGYWG